MRSEKTHQNWAQTVQPFRSAPSLPQWLAPSVLTWIVRLTFSKNWTVCEHQGNGEYVSELFLTTRNSNTGYIEFFLVVLQKLIEPKIIAKIPWCECNWYKTLLHYNPEPCFSIACKRKPFYHKFKQLSVCLVHVFILYILTTVEIWNKIKSFFSLMLKIYICFLGVLPLNPTKEAVIKKQFTIFTL